MYKFLVCVLAAGTNEEYWYYTSSRAMYPPWSSKIKEAVLVGYYSKAQAKWITSGTAIQLVSDYKKVKCAMPDSELILITLRVTREAVDEFNSMNAHVFEAEWPG